MATLSLLAIAGLGCPLDAAPGGALGVIVGTGVAVGVGFGAAKSGSGCFTAGGLAVAVVDATGRIAVRSRSVVRQITKPAREPSSIIPTTAPTTNGQAFRLGTISPTA